MSINMNIRFAVNTHGRDKDWDFEALASRYEDKEGSLESVLEHVLAGHALCAGLLGGQRRSKANVIGSQWLLLDIDNSEIWRDKDGNPLDGDGKPLKIGSQFVDINGNAIAKSDGRKAHKIYKPELKLDEALENPFVQRHCALIYTTASHSPLWHRFRMIFLLPEVVEGADAIEAMVRLLHQHFPHDPSCKDASRVFYGNSQAEVPLFDSSATLPADWLEQALELADEAKAQREQAIAQAEAKREALRRAAQSDGWDIDELIQKALSYIPPRQPGSSNYDECRTVLMALHSHYGSGAEAIAESWSPSIKGSTWNIRQKLRSFRRGGVSIGSLFHLAKQYGFEFPQGVKDVIKEEYRREGILSPKQQAAIESAQKDPEPPDFDTTLDEVEAIESKIDNDSRLDWAIKNYAYDTGLSKRGFSGKYLLQQLHARKDGQADLIVEDAIDILNDGDEERQWLVRGVVPANSTIVCGAEGGLGKTTFWYSVAKHLALGTPWSGYEVSQGRSLIIQVDEPKADMQDKFRTQNYWDVPKGLIKVIRRWRFSQMRQLTKVIHEFQPSLVIIDSYTAAHAGLGIELTNSNAGDSIYKLRDYADECQWPISFVILHHMNKMGSLRDSSTIKDNCSEVWNMSIPPKEMELGRNEILLTIPKSRAGLQGEYRLEKNPIDYSWNHLGLLQEDQGMQHVIQVVQEMGKKVSAKEVVQEMGGTYDSKLLSLERARRMGLIESEYRAGISEKGAYRFRVYWKDKEGTHPEANEVLEPAIAFPSVNLSDLNPDEWVEF